MASTIEWTDETWNPVTGCTRVSPGCDNCYMFALYPRLRAMGVRGYESAPDEISDFSLNAWMLPSTGENPATSSSTACPMSFTPTFPSSSLPKSSTLWKQASAERGHVFQVLTKRPGRAVAWWNQNRDRYGDEWPAGVWMGTSVESQKYAPRITVLARLPAPVRFVSAEPLLEAVDLSPWLEQRRPPMGHRRRRERSLRPPHEPRLGKNTYATRHLDAGRSLLPQATRRQTQQALRQSSPPRRPNLDPNARRS